MTDENATWPPKVAMLPGSLAVNQPSQEVFTSQCQPYILISLFFEERLPPPPRNTKSTTC